MGDKYNDDYIPETDEDRDDKLSMYLAQEFKKFMALSVSVKY